MKKIKILCICILMIIISLFSINVRAFDQKSYKAGNGWAYIIDPIQARDETYNMFYSNNDLNSHLGTTSMTYRIASSATVWSTDITAGTNIITIMTFIDNTNYPNDPAVCLFETVNSLGDGTYGLTPIRPHKVSGNHVTKFTVQLSEEYFLILGATTKRSVVAHEIGHGIGLAHVNDNNSLMKQGKFNTTLTIDDINGIKAVTDSCKSSGGHDLVNIGNQESCIICGAYRNSDHVHDTNSGYTIINDSQHSYLCDYCNKTILDYHSFYNNNVKCIFCKTPHPSSHTSSWEKDDPTYHWQICSTSWCDYIFSTKANHTWPSNPASISNYEHSKTCPDCKKTVTENHTPLLGVYVDNFYHKGICSKCNNSNAYEKHYSTGSPSALPPSDPQYISVHKILCSKCNSYYTELHIKVKLRGCSYEYCADGCGYENGTHDNMTYTNNGSSGHTQKCGGCAYQATVAHTLTNGTCTYKSCVCGYSTGSSSHGNYTYTSNGSSGHTQKCGNCQATIATSVHTMTNGTCTYKSCSSNCGYSTGSSSHNMVNGTCTYKSCSNGCGYSTGSSSHNMVSGTCTYKSCSNGCGYSTGSSSHGNYNYTSNGSSGHTQKCGNCQATIGTSTHSMVNGTCTYKSCSSNCGYSTGQSSHTYVWAYGPSTHYQMCNPCGSQINSGNHNMVASGSCSYKSCSSNCGHSTGSSSHGNYTYVSNGNGTHNQKCGYCLVTTASSIPHNYGTGTSCTSGCGSTHTHVSSSTWSTDSSQHWKNCTTSGCSYQYSLGPHGNYSYVSMGSSGHQPKCSTCSHQGSTVAHTFTTTNGVTKCVPCGYIKP